mgnify:CR=1 FL=1
MWDELSGFMGDMGCMAVLFLPACLYVVALFASYVNDQGDGPE